MSLYYSIAFAAILATLAAPLQEDHQLTSAEQFNVYRGLFAGRPLSGEDFEKLVPDLTQEGFTTSDQIHWRMSDASGSVLILALPDSGMFSVHYWPSSTGQLGGTALAALINRAESIEISAGDMITLTISSRSLAALGQRGSYSETLKFSLQHGAWMETAAHIDWSDAGGPPN